MKRLLLCLTALSTPIAAQEPAREGAVPFTWRERITQGAWLRVYNYQGSVDAMEVTGDIAQVQAETSVRSRSWGEPRYEVLRDGSDVVLCVLPEDRGICRRDGISNRSTRSGHERSSSVAVVIRVPRGVKLAVWSGNGAVQVTGVASEVDASSGNGAVTVTGSGGPVQAYSGNGDVEVATARGPVSARSGNGSVWAQMRELGSTEDMEFHSGNGRITVELPPGFEGLLEASTANGHIESDFPVTVEGRFSVSRLSGRIGRGAGNGRRIKLWTGNGDLELRQIGSAATPRRR
jgi:hypothetical protein